MVAAGLCLAAPRPAAGGVTLVSRDSEIRSAGGTGLDGHQHAVGFNTLADQVGNPDAPVDGRTAIAHQYATVGRLGVSGSGLEGAFGEGQVRALTTPGAAAATAASGFDLTFHVEGSPSAFTFGATLGAAGGGTAVVWLAPVVGGVTGSPILASAVEPHEGGDAGVGHVVEQSGFLAPGQYVLHARADGQDRLGDGESNAYFSFNLVMSGAGVGGNPGGPPGGDPPPAVPVPAAVMSGGGLLGLLAGRRLFARLPSV